MPTDGLICEEGRQAFGTSAIYMIGPGEATFAPDYFNYFFLCLPTGKTVGRSVIEVVQPGGSTLKPDPANWTPTRRAA